jgi:hypothetical protein
MSKTKGRKALAGSPQTYGPALLVYSVDLENYLTSTRVEGSTFRIRRMMKATKPTDLKPTLGTGSHSRLVDSSPVLLPAR